MNLGNLPKMMCCSPISSCFSRHFLQLSNKETSEVHTEETPVCEQIIIECHFLLLVEALLKLLHPKTDIPGKDVVLNYTPKWMTSLDPHSVPSADYREWSIAVFGLGTPSLIAGDPNLSYS